MPEFPDNGKIPEFPTIVLPMLTIIGLALIFRRK
ncbi:MAG: PEF-CTERM sorting domain-containing protein [Methanolobus sp.]|nr:PEF-CTERM sorting domain-containing protein [Methanolobus sp.]MDP2218479.1 PEF-CTERM sorting domain-containing protein [Methanolobus sp.]